MRVDPTLRPPLREPELSRAGFCREIPVGTPDAGVEGMAKWARIAMIVLVVWSVVTAAPSSGHAQDAETPPAEAEVSRWWYGWQVLLAGLSLPVALFASAATGVTARSPPLAITLVIGSALSPAAPAVVHALHGHAGRAATSLALDVGAPVAMGLLVAAGEAMDDDQGGGGGWFRGGFDLGPVGGFIIGYALLAPIAIFVDAMALSWDETVVEAGTSAHLRPSLQVAPDQTTVGIAGVF